MGRCYPYWTAMVVVALLSLTPAAKITGTLLAVVTVNLPLSRTYAKVVLDHLTREGFAELTSHFRGMMKMETSINARPEYLVQLIARILESVLVEAVRESLAVHRHVNAVVPKK